MESAEKIWRILIGTTLTSEHYLTAKTYEEATKQAEEVVATGETLGTIRDQIGSYEIEGTRNNHIESVEECKGEM